MVATSICALRSTAATLSLPSSATNSALAGKIDRKMVDPPRHLAERDPSPIVAEVMAKRQGLTIHKAAE